MTRVALATLQHVYVGKQTVGFRRKHSKKIDPLFCFSVQTNLETLDFCCFSERERDAWVVGLACAAKREGVLVTVHHFPLFVPDKLPELPGVSLGQYSRPLQFELRCSDLPRVGYLHIRFSYQNVSDLSILIQVGSTGVLNRRRPVVRLYQWHPLTKQLHYVAQTEQAPIDLTELLSTKLSNPDFSSKLELAWLPGVKQTVAFAVERTPENPFHPEPNQVEFSANEKKCKSKYRLGWVKLDLDALLFHEARGDGSLEGQVADAHSFLDSTNALTRVHTRNQTRAHARSLTLSRSHIHTHSGIACR